MATTSQLLLRKREERERIEHEMLAHLATKSTESRGRAHHEEPHEYRTAFERDRDRIIHTKAFRRLKHKTQVFLHPEGDHYLTRLTHTLQVTQIGRALAVSLGLNEVLTEAICLGHDVGHSPFGHTGEEALSPYVEGEWLHSAQGVRVLSVLEPQNLSFEVLDGIRAHSWRVDEPPATPEGFLCRFADRIAYLTHDVADSIRAGVIEFSDLPVEAVRRFGDSSREWIDSMIHSVVDASYQAGIVTMYDDDLEIMNLLRGFMFEQVYLRTEEEEQKRRAVVVIRDLVDHFSRHSHQIPASFRVEGADDLTAAIDYVSGMTDRFALNAHDRLFRPTLFD
jgi:dGTPase